MAKCEVKRNKPQGFEPVEVTLEITSQDMLDKAAALVETGALVQFMGAPWPQLSSALRDVGADPARYRAEIDEAID